ncbi:MAG: Bug family tripartite tricarboxylate transporter substrate binding protein [Xanthobacteraceae bacterium]
MHLRHALRLVAAALVAALGAMSGPACAQTYPTKSITLVVPLAAGTGMDSIARLYGEALSHSLGKPVVIDNRPGAAMMLALTSLARAQPDGYTLGIATSGPLATNPVLYKKIDYDPDKDFAPIALYVKSPFVLVVNPALPVHSVPDLITLAKGSTSPLTYSTPGVGLMQHLSTEFMKQRFGFDATHVPYRNTPQSVTDIVAGHVAFGFAEAGAAVPLIKEGKLRAIAVSSKTRLPILPEVPAFSEAIGTDDYEAVSWHVLLAPAATPAPVVDRLHGEMKRIMSGSDMVKKVSDLGLIPFDTQPIGGIRAYIRSEQEKWGSLVRTLGLAGSQ